MPTSLPHHLADPNPQVQALLALASVLNDVPEEYATAVAKGICPNYGPDLDINLADMADLLAAAQRLDDDNTRGSRQMDLQAETARDEARSVARWLVTTDMNKTPRLAVVAS